MTLPGLRSVRALGRRVRGWRGLVYEIVRRGLPTLRLGDSLFDGLQIMVTHGLEEVVVIEEARAEEAEDVAITAVVGLLKRSELQSFYQQRLLARELLG